MRSPAASAFMAGVALLVATLCYSHYCASTPALASSAIRSSGMRFSMAGVKPRTAMRSRVTRGLSRDQKVHAGESDYWMRPQAAAVVDEKEGVKEFQNMDSKFWDDIIRRDSRGLPEDVATAVSSSATQLCAVLGERADGPRLLSVAFELDPMPWWTFSDSYMRLNILKEMAANNPETKYALLVEDVADFEKENIGLGPNFVVGEISEAHLSLSGVKHMFVLGADVTTPEKLDTLRRQSMKTGSGDIIGIGCNFGYIGDPGPRAVRGKAKEWFVGGMDTVDFLLFPVHKLDEECRGSSADLNDNEVLAYPMPQWMKEAGYKGTANMAVSGCSGTGKSSLMNALRGIDTNDPEAAKVGNIETTMDATPYTFTEAACSMAEDDGTMCKGKEHFRLWDLPGAGTPKFPLNSYLRVMGIKYFDLVVVISAGRFTETDLTLMKEMGRNGVPYFAVRTKIDLEIENALWDMGMEEEETMEVIRDDLKKNTGLDDDRIFLVSARDPDKFDLPALKRKMNIIMQTGIEEKVDRALKRKLHSRRYFNTLVNVDDFVHADA
jgi:GTP-binding protein EngB required for normal cell division